MTYLKAHSFVQYHHKSISNNIFAFSITVRKECRVLDDTNAGSYVRPLGSGRLILKHVM
jgi:hypothetical protein